MFNMIISIKLQIQWCVERYMGGGGWVYHMALYTTSLLVLNEVQFSWNYVKTNNSFNCQVLEIKKINDGKNINLGSMFFFKVYFKIVNTKTYE